MTGRTYRPRREHLGEYLNKNRKHRSAPHLLVALFTPVLLLITAYITGYIVVLCGSKIDYVVLLPIKFVIVLLASAIPAIHSVWKIERTAMNEGYLLDGAIYGGIAGIVLGLIGSWNESLNTFSRQSFTTFDSIYATYVPLAFSVMTQIICFSFAGAIIGVFSVACIASYQKAQAGRSKGGRYR